METTPNQENFMENSNHFKTGHIVLTALGGALAGAGIALLLAPKTGKDTRHQFGGYIDAAKERASRVPGAFKNAGSAAMEAMSHEAEVVVSNKKTSTKS